MEPADDNSGGHSTSRHQPNPQILSHDQIFRAQVGETLVLPCQVANLGKVFEKKNNTSKAEILKNYEISTVDFF